MNAYRQPEVWFSTESWSKSSLHRKRIGKQSGWMMSFHPTSLYIYEVSLAGQMTKLPLELKWRHTPLWGTLVKTWYFSSGGHTFATVRVISTQAPRSWRMSPDIEASRRARIPFLPAEPLVLVLWINRLIWKFLGEPPQTLCANYGCDLLPCTGSYPWLHLAFHATMQPALDPVRPSGPSSQAYLSLHSIEAPQG
jgi:hypothetical protein